MPKINVYVPDELAEAVKDAGVPVSAVCQRALEQAVRRVTAIRQTALGELSADDLSDRLPHFTPRTHAVLKLAIDRASAADRPSVGTGDLLAGMIDEGTNLALHVLRAIDIDPAAVRRALERRPDAEPDGPAGTAVRSGTGEEASRLSGVGGGSEDRVSRHFSAAAAGAMELAVTEATSFGHNYVGCEHLLLGLVAEPDGTAGQVLRELGAEPRLTRRAVTAALAGYVHLRAQTSGAGPQPSAAPAAGASARPAAGPGAASAVAPGAASGAGADPAQLIAAVVQEQVRPLIERVERLERTLGAPSAE
ncbi:hypothetical protein Skr01_73460 [Sphaerisporangium krabiense]|uniref:ATP-dependent Clp protease ATP-binding subunit ClpC n=1 Tax=Sphaerisporangium krabiense TaxID=763782 RepID=A0A7W9DSE0_9ACTN|nr:Clp protease N-terminal domain-containing protein [Sphaerisporangium krabiense]MBB5629602.1 ATP-dependent Clp protease ATP-binding subunit ClpC [Sphaerisporangium krabiense]GII67261.1 hypothetical protein Skr01_73460 [Sphaerisporangium krabiense]